MSGDERQLYQWQDRPYMAHGKRHIAVEHRIIANWYPWVGVDLRHEIRCPKRGYESWTAAVTYEVREHGVQKVVTKAGRALP
jgi:hypothetical protein